jgi:hypothetical protein
MTPSRPHSPSETRIAGCILRAVCVPLEFRGTGAFAVDSHLKSKILNLKLPHRSIATSFCSVAVRTAGLSPALFPAVVFQ